MYLICYIIKKIIFVLYFIALVIQKSESYSCTSCDLLKNLHVKWNEQSWLIFFLVTFGIIAKMLCQVNIFFKDPCALYEQNK